MTFVEDYFGSQIFRSAAESVCTAFNYFSKTEVSQLEISRSVDEQVLWLQVAINDIPRVKVLENTDYLRDVKSD